MKLSNARANDKIKIVDENLLSKIPQLRNKELIVSVVKYSGNRLFCQYFSPTSGSGTLKVTYDPEIEILSKEDILTLSEFLQKERWANRKPVSLTLNINGNLSQYQIPDSFWSQNFKNIRLKGLMKAGMSYSVPGSSIVKDYQYEKRDS